ncbi:nuclear transport factor 2 family protein [Pigmentiphaga aceris]|uniref:Nuclear transport factor 2 family protein n=1 Tax=Pigmentiphaga aceris TaxID=1940612 RepID=A0A5C0AVM5_9BURK|nr:nuclear transport factor 2 family protein [Pigmentiphaga aceris]QEI04427.1 nuclear transport factor 2 family protein [Pigmentiphaga aceris]
MNVLDDLLAWYETLTPDTLDAVPRFYDDHARFKDPFNEVHGHAGIRRIFAHMFETTESPRFVIHERIVQGDQAFVTWTFHFGLRGQAYTVVGGSHLRFGADGRVTEHRDYWDAAEELFQKLPVIGPAVRWLRGRFAVSH